MKLDLKIYNPSSAVNVAGDWNIQAESASLSEVLSQSFSIACVPACYTQPWNFAYSHETAQVDLSQFDLVVISDIEQERVRSILNWIQDKKIKNYVVALGATHNSETVDYSKMMFRPWWMFNLMRLNTDQYEPRPDQQRSFWFDVLLGARRPHRDFVMLQLQKHQPLLDQSLVTYRSGFIGDVIDDQTKNIHNYFKDQTLCWPYVSPNLDNDWEVQAKFDKSMSPYVPWKIYNQCWYTAVCETAFTGDGFFPTEKISKALYGRRIFVAFAPCQYLKYLREIGFQTFGDIIDESYDEELVDLERYKQAFAEMMSLTWQDPKKLHKQVEQILQHNFDHMKTLQTQTQQQMQQLLIKNIPAEFILDPVV